MRITDIQTFSLGCDGGVVGLRRGFCIVKVITDAGIVGYGEATTSYGHIYPSVADSIVEAAIKPAIIGKNPLDIRSRIHDMKLYVHPWLGWDGISAQTIGAVETALWDILGKEKGMPIYQLFGAARDRIPLYGTGAIRQIEKGDEQAWHGKYFKELLDKGMRGVKTRIASGLEADVGQVAAVRKYLGPNHRLMVDGYFSYTPSTAIELAKRIAEYDIFWLEEPVPQHMLPGLERLHEASPVPIAYGERTYSLSGFEILVNRKTVDILQPDATVCGGILECVEVDALAKANNLKVFPHIGGLTAVGLAANIHLAAIINAEMLEYDSNPYQPLRDEILRDSIFAWDRIEDGCIKVPDGPGLGIEIDESVFEKFPFEKGKYYPDVYPQCGLGHF